jgi:hypothetical protein
MDHESRSNRSIYVQQCSTQSLVTLLYWVLFLLINNWKLACGYIIFYACSFLEIILLMSEHAGTLYGRPSLVVISVGNAKLFAQTKRYAYAYILWPAFVKDQHGQLTNIFSKVRPLVGEIRSEIDLTKHLMGLVSSTETRIV